MSEELRKELKNINKQILEARDSYNLSASNGYYNKNIYNRIIEIEAQAQTVIKLMKRYCYVK